mmetsp:Transcript_107847/g.281552  ORF Transcript_107847/g.281552 Transcript_107847/m.281552 type:complete len:233 (+) Transcript_107847:11-709(+)
MPDLSLPQAVTHAGPAQAPTQAAVHRSPRTTSSRTRRLHHGNLVEEEAAEHALAVVGGQRHILSLGPHGHHRRLLPGGRGVRRAARAGGGGVGSDAGAYLRLLLRLLDNDFRHVRHGLTPEVVLVRHAQRECFLEPGQQVGSEGLGAGDGLGLGALELSKAIAGGLELRLEGVEAVLLGAVVLRTASVVVPVVVRDHVVLPDVPVQQALEGERRKDRGPQQGPDDDGEGVGV